MIDAIGFPVDLIGRFRAFRIEIPAAESLMLVIATYVTMTVEVITFLEVGYIRLGEEVLVVNAFVVIIAVIKVTSVGYKGDANDSLPTGIQRNVAFRDIVPRIYRLPAAVRVQIPAGKRIIIFRIPGIWIIVDHLSGKNRTVILTLAGHVDKSAVGVKRDEIAVRPAGIQANAILSRIELCFGRRGRLRARGIKIPADERLVPIAVHGAKGLIGHIGAFIKTEFYLRKVRVVIKVPTVGVKDNRKYPDPFGIQRHIFNRNIVPRIYLFAAALRRQIPARKPITFLGIPHPGIAIDRLSGQDCKGHLFLSLPVDIAAVGVKRDEITVRPAGKKGHVMIGIIGFVDGAGNLRAVLIEIPAVERLMRIMVFDAEISIDTVFIPASEAPLEVFLFAIVSFVVIPPVGNKVTSVCFQCDLIEHAPTGIQRDVAVRHIIPGIDRIFVALGRQIPSLKFVMIIIIVGRIRDIAGIDRVSRRKCDRPVRSIAIVAAVGVKGH